MSITNIIITEIHDFSLFPLSKYEILYPLFEMKEQITILNMLKTI